MDPDTARYLKRLIALGIASASTGVALRGVLGGVKNVTAPASATSPGQKIVVPVPVMPQKSRKKSPLAPAPTAEMPEPSFGIGKFGNDSPTWYAPAAVGVGIPALYFGYKGMDSYLNNREKTKMNEELNEARKRFRTALVESLGQVPVVPKTAMDMMAVEVKSGNMAGNIAAGSTVFALLAAKMMYDAAAARSPSEILAKAEQRRQREMAARNPPPIELAPVPVKMDSAGGVHVIDSSRIG